MEEPQWPNDCVKEDGFFFLALGLWRHEGIAQEITGITLMKTYTTHAQNVPTYHFIAKTKQTRETLQKKNIYI